MRAPAVYYYLRIVVAMYFSERAGSLDGYPSLATGIVLDAAQQWRAPHPSRRPIWTPGWVEMSCTAWFKSLASMIKRPPVLVLRPFVV